MLKRIATMLLGKFESRDELKKFTLLGFMFCLLIGIYWALRPMKDSIFMTMVGVDYQPWAKILSLVIIVPLIIVYGKLIDLFPRHKVFYGLTSFYAVLALIFAFLFMHPEIGIANATESPTRILGWVWYVYVESFGSLIIALFWAFITDITAPASAERGFPFIGLLGQIGNIIGPKFLTARKLGFVNSAPVVGIVAGFMFALVLLLWVFMRVVPKSQMVGFHAKGSEEKHSEPGFLEGLKLLISQGYLMGIFLIITIYEVIVTVLDYHFKSTAKAVYPAEADLSDYLATYASMTGVIAFLCILFGINNIQRRLGMKISLILTPFIVMLAVIVVKFNPTALTIAFWIMVFSKAVNYALNQPTLKLLYIPTTKDAKYKSQAWIEMFGGRASKGTGSVINMFKGVFKTKYGAVTGIPAFLTLVTGLSAAMVVAWLFVAMYVSKKYDRAIRHKEVVC